MKFKKRFALLCLSLCAAISSIAFAEEKKLDLSLEMQKADSGDSDAQYLVGRAYFKADGLPKDFTKAADYLKESLNRDTLVTTDT